MLYVSRRPITWLAAKRLLSALRYIMQTYVRPNMVFTRGEGARMYDATGKEYLDFAAGIAVNALGAACPETDMLWAPLSVAQAELDTPLLCWPDVAVLPPAPCLACCALAKLASSASLFSVRCIRSCLRLASTRCTREGNSSYPFLLAACVVSERQCGRPQRRAVAGGADRAGGRAGAHVQPVPHRAAGA
jgi:hypothetical protein